jgi:cytochrome oxidase Cu insertion factor (SCO1/SenC/PrrC family)
MRRRILVGVAAIAAAALATACGESDRAVDGDGETPGTEAFAGFERTPRPAVGDLTLPAIEPDGSESEFAFRAPPGGLLLVYFGYTHCPDVCPTTLADIKAARREIGDDAERVEVAMATVDPARDTAEVLPGYVRSFVPEGVALRTTDDARLRAVADVFGADYEVSTTPDGEVEVVHTGNLYAVDDDGLLRLTWTFGTPKDDLAADLERLLADS